MTTTSAAVAPGSRAAADWPRTLPGLAARGVVGAGLGALLVPVLLIALVVTPLTRTPAATAAGWVRQRLTWIDRLPRHDRPDGRRLPALLGIEILLGLVGGCVLVLVIAGITVAGALVYGAATGAAVPLLDAPTPGRINWTTVAWALPVGLVLCFLAACGLAGVVWLERMTWAALTRPNTDELERQVQRLHTTLDDVVAAVDLERRRIERDIHDGVQQRVVALSILLARVERTEDPIQQAELRGRARTETQQVLDELRDVAWRIHPTVLARDGLVAALEALRDRTPVPVELDITRPLEVDRATAAATYFVVSESVTNVIKHAAADHISIRIVRTADDVELVVTDDGAGGADPTGPGLTGLASRVVARGGTLRVTSPAGGPTTVQAVVPCG